MEWTRETKDILKTSPAEQTFLSDSSYFVEADVEQDNKDLSMVPILKPDTPESDRFHRRLSIEQISCSTFHSNMPIASGMQVNDYLSKGFSRESLPEKAVRLEHRLREAIEVGEARKVQLAMAELEAIEIMTPL